MLKKLISYTMKVRKVQLRSLMLYVHLFCCILLLNQASASAEICAEIDFNKPTIAGGMGVTVGLKEDGTVVTTGVSLNWTNIKAIAAGYGPRWGHIVGLKEDGTVVSTGGPDVSGWTNVKAIAAGSGFSIGLKEDGTVIGTNWTNIKAIAAYRRA